VKKLGPASFEIDEERVAWEGLASACSGPIRRFGAFVLVGFMSFIAVTTAVDLFYNLFGEHPAPWTVYDVTMLVGVAIAAGGYLVWLLWSLRSYAEFSAVLRRGGLDPGRPTSGGLRAYSDEQLLALRSRYERMREGKLKLILGRSFGFHDADEFCLGPLSVLPGTFEMGALRLE
jgi:hypothetical protein